MHYCIAKAREMEKNNTNKTKTLKKWGSKKVLAFLSMHPIPNNIQIKPAHKTKNPTPSKFLPSHLIPPQTFRGA